MDEKIDGDHSDCEGDQIFLNRRLQKTVAFWARREENIRQLFVDENDQVTQLPYNVCNVLCYWFGADMFIVHNRPNQLAGFTDADELWRQRWFAKKDQMILVDDYQRCHFTDLLESAKREELNLWCQTPLGTLALIVVLDQMSRNIYRNSAAAWDADELALRICLEAIEKGFDQILPIVLRSQFYMPIVHAESIELQKRCVEIYKELKLQMDASLLLLMDRFNKVAARHYDVIVVFGRYPERNEFLNRRSTAKERAYLSIE